MEIDRMAVHAEGIRFSVKDGALEVGRARLYILRNDIHNRPLGYIEDVFVSDGHRRLGIAGKIMLALIATAKDRGCYKLILHTEHVNKVALNLYRKLGFLEVGPTMRLDIPTN